MDRARFDGVVAYLGGLYGRELSHVQRAAGWKMLQSLPDAAVEKAIDAITEDGREQLPPWPMVYKTASSIALADRDKTQPALPPGDSLSGDEHRAAMIALRAKQTPEQRRRADAVTNGTKGLPMRVKMLVGAELLTRGNSRLSPEMWDAVLDEVLAREFQLHSPLVPARADLA